MTLLALLHGENIVERRAFFAKGAEAHRGEDAIFFNHIWFAAAQPARLSISYIVLQTAMPYDFQKSRSGT